MPITSGFEISSSFPLHERVCLPLKNESNFSIFSYLALLFEAKNTKDLS
jgi:hypothetical protein